MDHFPAKSWIELARGLCSDEQRDELQAHLKSGCAECQREFEIWQLVANMSRQEAQYIPPPEEVDWVKKAFLTRFKQQASEGVLHFARLLFDSLLQPNLATVRAISAASQQLLYESGSVVIDLQLQADAGRTTFLTGQILATEPERTPSQDTVVVLMTGDQEVARTTASKQGEFELEVVEYRDLSLRIETPGQEPLYVVLPKREQE